MWSISKVFRVPIGHRLSKHKGLCQNYHGHNFKIEVCVSSQTLDSNDMVMDFSNLKDIVNEILKDFDHALLLNLNDESVFNIPCKLMSLEEEGDPTAELLAKHLYNEVSSKLNLIKDVIKVKYVKVWENEDSCAEYSWQG